MRITPDNKQLRSSERGDREVESLLLAAGPRPQMPEEDFRLIKAAARVQWSELVASRRPLWTSAWFLAAAGAAAALVTVVGLGWWRSGPKPAPAEGELATIETIRGQVRLSDSAAPPLVTGGRLEAGAEIETGRSADLAENVIAFRLSAGQSVRLRSGSRARLLSSSRLQLVAGALFVDSGGAPNERTAIEVVTAYGTVVDVGTQFEVRVDEGGEAVRVRVRSGAVELTLDEKSHAAGAGEELRLLEDGSLARGAFEASAADLDWTLSAAPAIDIEGMPLPTFLAWVSRETGWTILFEDPVLEGAASTIELHETIEGLRPDEAISVVLPGSDLGHRLANGELHIERLPPGSNGM